MAKDILCDVYHFASFIALLFFLVVIGTSQLNARGLPYFEHDGWRMVNTKITTTQEIQGTTHKTIISTEIMYDKNGHVEKEVSYIDKNEKSTTNYDPYYNDNGKITKLITEYVVVHYKYREGLVKEKIITSDKAPPKKTEFRYDEDGKLLSSSTSMEMNDPPYLAEEGHSSYQYDSNGNISEEIYEYEGSSEYDSWTGKTVINYTWEQIADPDNPAPVVDPDNPAPSISFNDDKGSITISLDPGNKQGQNADWWIAVLTPKGWSSFVVKTESYGWEDGVNRCIEMPLVSLDSFQIPAPPLSKGKNAFIFAVDDNADGKPNATWWNIVEVNVE